MQSEACVNASHQFSHKPPDQRRFQSIRSQLYTRDYESNCNLGAHGAGLAD